ncbi:MAG TPA: serine/threonine-protein kinase [Gemmatimonadales bacterium]
MKICPVCSREYSDEIRFCQDDGTTLRAAAPASSLVGQVIADRYHVIKKLGEGGMGQVYLAEHVKMGRRSAIKVMSPAMIHDPDAIARFNREASNASRITHPNVCAVYDFGETPEGLIYLAMEFVEGVPLTDLIEQEGALPLARATAIFKQTADALQAAHDLGIVHRDLKPDNIMVARGRDGSDVVKVVDFGIAKAVGGDETGQKVTKTGLVVGTPEFMSPEQLSGDKVDGRSDLYALALVYFRMLTGQLPFQADSVQETMIKRLTDEPETLAAARPDLRFPDGLQQVLDTALARTPANRYQTVAKFADDVLGVVALRRGTQGATPATRAEIEAKTQVIDSHETRARKSVPRAEGKRRSFVPLFVGLVLVLGLGGGAWVMFGSHGAPESPAANDSTHLAATPPDTSKTVQMPDTTKQAPPVTHTATNPVSLSRGDTVKPAPLSNPTGAINVSRAFDALDDMMMNRLDATTALWVRDSAMKFYNAPGISRKDKAYAAFVIGNAWMNLKDRPQGCRWARTALQLDPGTTAYSQFIQQCQE